MTGEDRGKETSSYGNWPQVYFQFLIFFSGITSTLLNDVRVASELAVITPLRSASTLQEQLFQVYSWVISSAEVISLPQYHKQIAEFELKCASVSYTTKGCPRCPSIVGSALAHWFSFLIATLHGHHIQKAEGTALYWLHCFCRY